MKNVHRIERPTIEILGVSSYGKSETDYQIECFLSSRNIHITSDEYIGLNWYLDGELVRKGVIDDKDYWSVRKDYKKIIMTTDKKLIKDGIQPISEEVIKWFIDNPTCEEVKVIKERYLFQYPDVYDFRNKLILPIKVSRCCGRCNGVDDLCYTDMCCDDHHEYGCEICYGKRVEYVSEKCTCKIGEPYNNLCCKVHGKSNDDFENALDSFKTSLNNKYDDTKWDTEKIIDLIQFLSMNEDFNGYSSVSRHTAKHFLEEFKKQ